MHELAAARALFEETLKACAKNGVERPYLVEAELGALATYGKGPIRQYFGIIRKEHPGLSKTRLTIRTVPARMRCGSCGREAPVRRPTAISCGGCGSRDVALEGGRDLVIRRILTWKPSNKAGTRRRHGEEKCAERADARRPRKKRNSDCRGRILGGRGQQKAC